jgi:hypothetical protein
MLIAAGVPFGIVVSILLGIYIWQRNLHNRVDTMLADIQARDEPVSPLDLSIRYQLPDGAKDTTELWLRGMAALDGEEFGKDLAGLEFHTDDDAQFPIPGEPWVDADAAQSLLQKYADQLKLLHEAAEAEGDVRYDLKFEEGLMLMLPHCRQLRQAARLLQIEVAALAHQGDADGAAQSIRTMGRLGETLRDEPVLISLLVRIAITRMNCETVRQTLPHVAYSNQQLVDMDAMLSERSFADGFHEALLGERVFGILAGEDPSTMGPGNATLPRFMKNAGIVHYLNAMSRPVEIAAGDGPEVLTELQELQEEIELQIKTDRSFDKIFTAILLPAFHAGAEAAVKGEVELDATRAAIAIERYRRHHGRLPATLDALVPDFLGRVPNDRFDGQPLRYAVDGNRVTIYSVGPNRQDDGGRSEDDADVKFEIAWPE